MQTEENRVLRSRPFTATERAVAWLLAGGIAAFAVTGLILGIQRGRWGMVAAALLMLCLAMLYAAAAWRGRPF
jgi:hypothetical protein